MFCYIFATLFIYLFILLSFCYQFARYFTRRFGSGLNYDTATYETFHKICVGIPYHNDNHHEEGMAQRLARRAMVYSLVITVCDEDFPDPEVH